MATRRFRLCVLGLAAALVFLPAPLMLGYRLLANQIGIPIESLGPSFSLMGRPTKLGELVKRVLFQDNQNTGKVYVEHLPAPTVRSWSEGRWQQTFERWFEPRLALREPLVRTANQVYYSVFAKSYMHSGNLIFGAEQQFYERCYIDDACNMLKAPTPAQDAAAVAQIAELSRRWRGKGRAFAVMIVPHKAEMVTEHVPARYCANPGRSQRRKQLISALRASGVVVVDPEHDILALAELKRLPAYPRGGTHWSELGAFAASSMLLTELGTQLGQPLRSEQPAEYELYPRPYGQDADLVALANLAFPPLDYQAPRLVFPGNGKGPAFSSRRLVILGDSFTYTLAEILQAQRAFATMTHYFYYYLGRYDYPGRVRSEVARNAVNWEADILPADALIMVGNAVTFMAPENIEFLADALSHTGGRDASAKL